jgi:hypothetical protein
VTIDDTARPLPMIHSRRLARVRRFLLAFPDSVGHNIAFKPLPAWPSHMTAFR